MSPRAGQLGGGKGLRFVEYRRSWQDQCFALPGLSSSLPPGALGRLSLSASFREWLLGGRVVENKSRPGAAEVHSEPDRERLVTGVMVWPG